MALQMRGATRAPQAGCSSRSRSHTLRVYAAAATTKRKGNVGFKWDPANSRWVRDDRFAGIAADEGRTLIKPKTGAAYQAWPVVHTTLSDAGLKGVDVQEVSSSLQDSTSSCLTVLLAPRCGIICISCGPSPVIS
eukprot:GHRQ01021256.1.p1 GENE.GHRQ01021256.1~~GHRQ01021256.1.p1  ORF type:complete len:135 (+),score=5.55 GHRQ01021256.1:725-1129(+)